MELKFFSKKGLFVNVHLLLLLFRVQIGGSGNEADCACCKSVRVLLALASPLRLFGKGNVVDFGLWLNKHRLHLDLRICEGDNGVIVTIDPGVDGGDILCGLCVNFDLKLINETLELFIKHSHLFIVLTRHVCYPVVSNTLKVISCLANILLGHLSFSHILLLLKLFK